MKLAIFTNAGDLFLSYEFLCDSNTTRDFANHGRT